MMMMTAEVLQRTVIAVCKCKVVLTARFSLDNPTTNQPCTRLTPPSPRHTHLVASKMYLKKKKRGLSNWKNRKITTLSLNGAKLNFFFLNKTKLNCLID